MGTIDIKTTIRGSLPRISYEAIARDILGARFELSLVICGDALARTMNGKYRKNSYKPNVLSFPLSKTEGEIFLNARKAEREARLYGTTLQKRLALLFVHGCYHLKGLDHETEKETRHMEALERATLKKFKLL